mmetsp:Transcript_35796/g.63476  ORF Transcript_35796/g.63476 Transcript_35796/m.63476 type:complete len:383 (+) Transcript_35796:68-1216(+)
MPWKPATPVVPGQDLQFALGKRLGQGSFGQVFRAADASTGEEVAVKVEYPVTKFSSLSFEAKVLKRLSAHHGFPKFHSLGKEGYYHFLAMELLGPSLESLFNKRERNFSLKTRLMLAQQMVRRLEYLHLKGYVHRDVKPENFLIGRGGRRNVVHLIDFGLAKKLEPAKPRLPRRSLIGTARYASISAHDGAEQFAKDDLQALAYVLIYFSVGSLPWQGIRAETKEEKHEKIKEMKSEISAEELCNGCHEVFARLLHYTHGLGLQEEPDYKFIYWMFSDVMTAEGYQNDGQFDWVTKPMRSDSRQPSKKDAALASQGRLEVGRSSHGEDPTGDTKPKVSPQQSADTLCTTTAASSKGRPGTSAKRGFLPTLLGCFSVSSAKPE